jgi:hypothetical protein
VQVDKRIDNEARNNAIKNLRMDKITFSKITDEYYKLLSIKFKLEGYVEIGAKPKQELPEKYKERLEELSKIRDKFEAGKKKIKEELRLVESKKNRVKECAFEYQIIEEIKFLNSPSWVAVNLVFGLHKDFLNKNTEEKASVIGSVFDSFSKGKIVLRQVDPSKLKPSAVELVYGRGIENIIKTHKKHNAIVREMFKNLPKN